MTSFKIAFHVLQLALLLGIIYIYLRTRALKRKQDALVEQLQGKHYWRINAASPEHAQKFLRWLPFEVKGVLIDDADSIHIRGIRLVGSLAFEMRALKKDCSIEWLGNKSLRSGNLYWARLTTPEGSILFSADTGAYALPSREALADIFRSVFPDYPLTPNEKSDFALEKNARSLTTSILFLALLLFALLDTYIFSRYELIDAQLWQLSRDPWLWAGAGAGLLTLVVLMYQFLRRGNVPSRESLALATFLGFTVLGSTMPVLKRVDQGLARAPTQDYDYVVVSTGLLKPVNMSLGLPDLRFRRAPEYWQQFPPQSPYRVPLLRGPSGLWQLSHDRFDPVIIEFYEKRKAGQ